MAYIGHRYTEWAIGIVTMCALVGGLVAFDDRVRTLFVGRVSVNSISNMSGLFGEGQRWVYSTYSMIATNPFYAPLALFGILAGGLTILMLRT